MNRRRRTWWGAALLAAALVASAPAASAPGKARETPALTEARRLANESAALYAAGKYDEAIAAGERALHAREKLLGPDHLDVATSLHDLAEVNGDKEDYARAEELHLRALAIREKALGPRHPDVATSLCDLAIIYVKKGEPARAEPLLARSLAIREAALGPEHADVATSLHALAAVHREGDPAGAERLILRAIAIREKALGPEHTDLASSLNFLGALHFDQGDFARAERVFARALAIREKILGPDHIALATMLSNLAVVYQEQGDLASGEPLLERAIALQEKALGPDGPDLATSLSNLALLQVDRGEYVRSEALLLRALSIGEKAFGPDHPDLTVFLTNLGHLYVARADYARAERCLLRAIAIEEKAHGPESSDFAMLLGTLALLYRSEGDLARAVPLLERSLRVVEKALRPGHPLVGRALMNLGATYLRRGEVARAEPLLLRALDILEKSRGPDHPEVANVLDHLGYGRQIAGDPRRAEAYLRRALDVREKTEGPEHARFATSLGLLAWAHVLAGDVAAAVVELDRATTLRDRNAAVLLAVGSEEQKRAYMLSLAPDVDATLSLHLRFAPASPDAARLALTTVLRRKGRLLDAVTDGFAALRRRLAPGDQQLLDRLASVDGRLAAQMSRGRGLLSAAQYRASLAGLEDERAALEREVSRVSAEFRADQRLVSIEDVRAAIPEGAALVEIARWRPLDPGDPRAQRGSPRYAAYVLHRSGAVGFADLGDAAEIDAIVGRLRKALADPTLDPRLAARALDARILGPLREALGDARRVFLSPDGALNLVPFGVLLDEDGHYRVEGRSFTYLASGRDLLRFGAGGLPREGPLVIAAPAFGSAGSALDSAAPPAGGRRSVDLSLLHFKPLPGTAIEARAVSARLPGARLLLGDAATKPALEAAHAPSVLHVATHGFFLADQEIVVHPLLAPGAEVDASALLRVENPLLRAGLALAGANRRDGDSGVLTALEASQLDLHGTRLVVLSACDTGVGEVRSSDGVYGMRRALTMAGAETLVMSLWAVDDEATRALMTAYYGNLASGEGRVEGMRRAQLALLARKETAHPFYWAGFIVSGNDAALDGRPAAPELARLPPGLRGCACSLGEEDGARGPGALVIAALGLAVLRCRRHTPRSGARLNR